MNAGFWAFGKLSRKNSQANIVECRYYEEFKSSTNSVFYSLPTLQALFESRKV